MSTIRANKLEHISTANGGIQLDSSGHVTVDGQQMPTAGPLSNRNIIINGAMQIAQRGTSTTGVTSSGIYCVDRFKIGLSSLGAYTMTQESDGPAGFSKSFKIDCTTADSSPAASNFFKLDYNIEGQDLQHLDYGASTAKPLTLTFYVKSNKTGNASIEIQQKDNSDRQITPQYTISAANTWEKKTISVPADASGLIDDDNGTGLRVTWWLNSGSAYQGGSHQTTWVAETNPDRNVSNLGIGGSTSDYFQITGIQLEVGEKATPFEHRSYGDELARCQRYFERIGGTKYAQIGTGMQRQTTQTYFSTSFKVQKRAAPTASYVGSIITSDRYSHDENVTALQDTNISVDGIHARFAHNGVGAERQAAFITSAGGSPFGYMDFNAEL